MVAMSSELVNKNGDSIRQQKLGTKIPRELNRNPQFSLLGILGNRREGTRLLSAHRMGFELFYLNIHGKGDLRRQMDLEISRNNHLLEFPGGLAVRIQHFHCYGPGSIPGQGTEIPQDAKHCQRKKKEKQSS